MADYTADTSWIDCHALRRDEEAGGGAVAAQRIDAVEDARAEEPPERRFKRLIRQMGPLPLAQFMAESNALYYSSRDPLGDAGDFLTAPEISQMFGELIGLWLADIWVRAGRNEPLHYVELGPGRGTLAHDALRCAALYGLKPRVHFLEASAALRALQREKFPDAIHHDDLTSLPDDGPLLVVANEFFDALPVRQLVRTEAGWRERMVGLEDDRLVFVAGDKPMDAAVPSGWSKASPGTLIETSPASAALMGEIARRIAKQGGAGLAIDYGSREFSTGSTLQAVSGHQKIDPLAAPGEADLSAHVDFEALARIARENGATVMGLAHQGGWLKALGIDARLEALQRKAPGQSDVLARQHHRLVSDDQMGLLFKVLGIGAQDWPQGAGFG